MSIIKFDNKTDANKLLVQHNGNVVAEFNGTGFKANVLKANPSAAPDDIVVQSQVLGVGVTMQNLTTSRALGTNYTNVRGRPIVLWARATTSVPGAQLVGRLSGSARVTDPNTLASGTATLYIELTVPAGVVYAIDSGNMTLVEWWEF